MHRIAVLAIAFGLFPDMANALAHLCQPAADSPSGGSAEQPEEPEPPRKRARTDADGEHSPEDDDEGPLVATPESKLCTQRLCIMEAAAQANLLQGALAAQCVAWLRTAQPNPGWREGMLVPLLERLEPLAHVEEVQTDGNGDALPGLEEYAESSHYGDNGENGGASLPPAPADVDMAPES